MNGTTKHRTKRGMALLLTLALVLSLMTSLVAYASPAGFMHEAEPPCLLESLLDSQAVPPITSEQPQAELEQPPTVPPITSEQPQTGLEQPPVVSPTVPQLSITAVEILSFMPLAAEVANQNVPWGTQLEELNLPIELVATASSAALPVGADREAVLSEMTEVVSVPITWVAESLFNGNAVGVYHFNAELGADFVLAPGLVAPQIMAEVQPLTFAEFGFPITDEDSLRAAINNGESLIQLMNDIETTSTLTIPAGTDIRIIGEYSLIATGSFSVITIADGGTFRLGNLGEPGPTITRASGANVGHGVLAGTAGGVGGRFHMYSGTIRGHGLANNNSNGVSFHDNGIFYMHGGEISGNRSSGVVGSGVTFSSNGTFHMNGGTISGNTSNAPGGGGSGSGVHFGPGGLFVMRDGATISGNTGAGGVGLPVNGTFTMYGGEISGNTGGGVRFSTNGTFTMYSGEISGNTTSNVGGGVNFFDSGTFHMNGGTISDNVAHMGPGGGVNFSDGGLFVMHDGAVISGNDGMGRGGGVNFSRSGTFNMYGGEISGNRARTDFAAGFGGTGGGGGVSISGGTFTMYNGKINGNTTTWYGGGVVSNSGKFIMHNGEISGNHASFWGGGVLADGEFIMHNGNIIYNELSGGTGAWGIEYGGGVAVVGMFTRESTFSMNGGNISYNGAGTNMFGHGGGVGVGHSSTFTMNDGTISGNTATARNPFIVADIFEGNGGGVWVSPTGTFTMNTGEISGNTAYLGGGGVYTLGTFNLHGGTIGHANSDSGNRALGDSPDLGAGGGIHVATNGTLYMNPINAPVDIIGNSAISNGGGVFVAPFSQAMMINGTIHNNSATNGGGVQVWSDGIFTMTDGKISGNTADEDGGGVFVWDDGIFTMTDGEISNNTAEDYGGGIFAMYYPDITISSTVIFGGNRAIPTIDWSRHLLYPTTDIVPAELSGGGQGGYVGTNVNWASVSTSGTHPLNNFDINFFYETPTTSITVIKAWDDNNDAANMRPASITVQLYADGEAEGDPVTISAPWTHTFTDLPIYSTSREPIAYMVEEINVPTGYTPNIVMTGNAVNGFIVNITNVFTHNLQNYNLVINKSADTPHGGLVMQNGIVTYTITVHNSGSVASNNVVIIDNIPYGMTLVPNSATMSPNFSGNTLTWNIPSIAADATVLVSFCVTVNTLPTGVSERVFNNTAVVNGRNTNTITLRTIADPTPPLAPYNPTVPTDPTIPTLPTDPTISSTGQTQTRTSPQTGDTFTHMSLMVLALGFLLSISGVIFLIYKIREKSSIIK